ncbi:hypothetical protein SSP24_84220 [Streptomyces spinoverrucosus]|uniref:Uncharacterized protein n=1 Tax=Streptomyces spinoverrucosus TaxID=284043 RepID=A0A4Y3VV90_9ACTN|nr:hypothetical protein SSP24_84220 [Streptomyces spinoverrucosus]GHC00214.1 hypothetical protein GCM10010397_85180 [Streptomyces spinoverrucosus]
MQLLDAAGQDQVIAQGALETPRWTNALLMRQKQAYPPVSSLRQGIRSRSTCPLTRCHRPQGYARP